MTCKILHKAQPSSSDRKLRRKRTRRCWERQCWIISGLSRAWDRFSLGSSSSVALQNASISGLLGHVTPILWPCYRSSAFEVQVCRPGGGAPTLSRGIGGTILFLLDKIFRMASSTEYPQKQTCYDQSATTKRRPFDFALQYLVLVIPYPLLRQSLMMKAHRQRSS